MLANTEADGVPLSVPATAQVALGAHYLQIELCVHH